MKNNELINAFFDGDLSEIEKESFIKQLDKDPDLKNEFEFHSEVIDGIKSARKAELIARLDAVTIGTSGTSGTSTWIKVAVIGGMATIGALTYYTLQDKDQEAQLVSPKQIEEPIDQLILEETEQIKSNDKQINALSESNNDLTEKKSTISSKEQVAIHKPDINKPDLVEPLEIESSDESELLPESGFAEEAPARLSNIAIEVDNSKKRYSFHYQIKEGNLYLFGDFDKGLYEILEFNSSGGKLLYLYYKQAYYDLKQSSSVITALKEISEPALIYKLETVRKEIKD